MMAKNVSKMPTSEKRLVPPLKVKGTLQSRDYTARNLTPVKTPYDVIEVGVTKYFFKFFEKFLFFGEKDFGKILFFKKKNLATPLHFSDVIYSVFTI